MCCMTYLISNPKRKGLILSFLILLWGRETLEGNRLVGCLRVRRGGGSHMDIIRVR